MVIKLLVLIRVKLSIMILNIFTLKFPPFFWLYCHLKYRKGLFSSYSLSPEGDRDVSYFGNTLMRLHPSLHVGNEDITATKLSGRSICNPTPSFFPHSPHLDTDICVNIQIVRTDLTYCFGLTQRGATNFHERRM